MFFFFFSAALVDMIVLEKRDKLIRARCFLSPIIFCGGAWYWYTNFSSLSTAKSVDLVVKDQGLNSADFVAILSGKTEKFSMKLTALKLLDVIERY